MFALNLISLLCFYFFNEFVLLLILLMEHHTQWHNGAIIKCLYYYCYYLESHTQNRKLTSLFEIRSKPSLVSTVISNQQLITTTPSYPVWTKSHENDSPSSVIVLSFMKRNLMIVMWHYQVRQCYVMLFWAVLGICYLLGYRCKSHWLFCYFVCSTSPS